MLPKTTQQRNTNKHAALSIHSLTHSRTHKRWHSIAWLQRLRYNGMLARYWTQLRWQYGDFTRVESLESCTQWGNIAQTHTLDVRKTFRTWLNHKEWEASDSCDFLPWLHNFAKFNQTLHKHTKNPSQMEWGNLSAPHANHKPHSHTQACSNRTTCVHIHIL